MYSGELHTKSDACPYCSGAGLIIYHSNLTDKRYPIKCAACNGTGKAQPYEHTKCTISIDDITQKMHQLKTAGIPSKMIPSYIAEYMEITLTASSPPHPGYVWVATVNIKRHRANAEMICIN